MSGVRHQLRRYPMTAGVMPLEPTLGRCRRCGRLSRLTAAFCPRCGIRLGEVPDALQAEILDDEPATGNWEILDSNPLRQPWPVMPIPPMPAIPVIPKARPLPFGSIAPSWSASRRPFARRNRIWLPIVIGFIIVRGMASVATHSSSARSYVAPTPPVPPIPPTYYQSASSPRHAHR